MLTREAKRQAFISLRTANYTASLRLEGMRLQKSGAKLPCLIMAKRKDKDA